MRITHSFLLAALFSLFILVPGCGSGEPVIPKSVGDLEILIVHNQYRALVGVAGLKWSEDLAEKARALIKTDSCVMLMNTEGLGQNTLSSTASVTQEFVVDLWAIIGSQYYIYDLDSCTFPLLGGHPNDECDAYKQIVWANSSFLGCASVHCFFQERVVWVCLYDPPGNVPGESPY